MVFWKGLRLRNYWIGDDMSIVDKINNYTIELVADSYDRFHNLVTTSKTDAEGNITFPLVELLETTDKKNWKKGKLKPLVVSITRAVNEAVQTQINLDNGDAPITEEIEDAQEDIEDELLNAVMDKLKKDIKENVARPHPENRPKDISLEELGLFFDRSLNGIKYQHKKINMEIMQSPMNPNLISGLPNKRVFDRRKDSPFWQEGIIALNKYPAMVENLKVIEGLLTETKQITADSRNQYLNIHIQGSINTLMGQLPQYSLAEKKTIYTYWKGIGDKFEDFAGKGDNLSAKLDKTLVFDSKASEKAQETIEASSDFKENWERMRGTRIGNYVTKFNKISVVNDKDEETAMKILVAFLNRRNAGLVMDDEEADRIQEQEQNEEDNEEEEDSLSMEASKTLGAKSGETSPLGKEIAQAFKEVDILSAMYIDSFLGGAIINSDSEKKKIVEILETYKGSITIPDKDSADLSSLIKDLKAIEIYDDNAYAPIQIMDMKYLASNYSDDGAKRIVRSKENAQFAKNYSNVNDVYLELFDTIANLITVSMGRGSSNIHGPTYTNFDSKTQQWKDKGRYSQLGLSRATVFQEPMEMDLKEIEEQEHKDDEAKEFALHNAKTHNELLKSLHIFIQAMDEYIITPILNSEMNMGIPFEFTNSVSFQTVTRYLKKHHSAISVEGTTINPDLVLFSALNDAHEERGGAQASSNDLTIIKDFLELLSKDFMFGELVTKTEDLAMALFNITNNSKWSSSEIEQAKDNIEKELAAFIGGVAKNIDYKQDIPKFHGKKPAEEYERSNIDKIGQIKSFVMIKDFIIANQKGLKAGLYNKVDTIVNLFNRLRKSDDIASKILSAHDSFRIIKGMPVYYGLKSPYCFDGMNNSIDSIKNKFSVDITAMEVNYILDEIDSFSNIAKSVGVSEELVYYVKADFR
jgi:hypothetical protein